jgi:hypothetical protein
MIDRSFKYGDRVQLTDAKGKLYSITLTQGSEWHTHKGMLKHDELVGLPEGSTKPMWHSIIFGQIASGRTILSMAMGCSPTKTPFQRQLMCA